MSSIEKLSIRGIRSFSPNREEIIEFYHPLTVIVGENGCGKTTIIECLKLACSGSFPPSAHSGQALIYDPKMAGTTEVKASIRLRFRNSAGQPMVVQRTFQAQQTSGKIKFKAMDGVIRIVNDLGEKVSLSQKCGELDRHIPEVLGVSKAILDNVIFCHQEESTWPLQEPKVLKKRFDDIFESSRYTKALEAISKLKKARGSIAKDLKRDLDVLNVNVKAAENVREKIELVQFKLSGMQKEKETLQQSLLEAEQEFTKAESIDQEIKNKHLQFEMLQSKLQQKEEDNKVSYDRLEEVMSDSDEKLHALLENYDKIISNVQNELENLQQQATQYREMQSKAKEAITNLYASKGSLEAKAEAVANQKRDILQLATRMGSKHGFSTPSTTSIDISNIPALIASFQRVTSIKKKELTDMENQHVIHDDKQQAKVSELKAKLHHVKEELKAKHAAMNKLNDEKLENSKTIKEYTGLTSALRSTTELENLIESASADLKSHREKHDIVKLKQDIESLDRARHELKFDLKQLDDKISLLDLHKFDEVKLQAQLSDYNKNKQDIYARVKDKLLECQLRFKSKPSSDVFEQLSAMNFEETTPSSSIQNACSKAVEALFNIVADRTKSVEETQTGLTLDDDKLKNKMAIIEHLEHEISALTNAKNELEQRDINVLLPLLQNVLPQVSSYELADVERAVTIVEKSYFDAKRKTLKCENTIAFLETYKQKGERDHACPLCQRKLSSVEEVAFVQSINEKTDDSRVHEKIRKAKAAEADALQTWKTLETKLPSWHKMQKLKQDIEQKSGELKGVYEAQRHLQDNISVKKQQLLLSIPGKDEAIGMHQDMCDLLDLIKGMQNNFQQVQQEENRLKNLISEKLGPNAPSLDSLQKTKKDKSTTLEDYTRQVDQKQAELRHFFEKTEQLQAVLRAKEQEKRNMDTLQSNYENALKTQQSLRNQDTELRDAITKISTAELTLTRDLKTETMNAQRERDSKRELLASCRSNYQHIMEDLRIFQDMAERMKKFDNSDTIENDLKQVLKNIDVQEQAQLNATQMLEALEPKIANTSKSLTEQESIKRKIRDNLDYRSTRVDLETLRNAYEIELQSLKSLPSAQEVEQRLKTSRQAVESVRDSKSSLRGRHEQLKEQLNEYQAQLRGPELQGIDEKHRRKTIEFETTNMAVADLDRYFKALGKALIEYHSTKVEEINSIIRTLWQITYKGQDIDAIELVSGAEDEMDENGQPIVGISKLNDKNKVKSYSYRVVMKKNGSPVEMRGRCSAGQKVLASVIIRLALAETFCLSCGILTLDEPTTNLDVENKFGLAQALSDILTARVGQQNFQLVCITHDEEFVQMLNQTQALDGSRPEFFWRVRRENMGNNRFCSKIDRCDWDTRA